MIGKELIAVIFEMYLYVLKYVVNLRSHDSPLK